MEEGNRRKGLHVAQGLSWSRCGDSNRSYSLHLALVPGLLVASNGQVAEAEGKKDNKIKLKWTSCCCFTSLLFYAVS